MRLLFPASKLLSAERCSEETADDRLRFVLHRHPALTGHVDLELLATYRDDIVRVGGAAVEGDGY